MERLVAAREAMATRFEMVLHGPDPIRLRAAADAGFHEIERLHAQLSLYSPSSEVSFINAHAADRPIKVEPQLFQLLQLAQRLHGETKGAFDITIAPLLRCWGFMGGSGKMPSSEEIEEARARVGMQHVILDERTRTVRFARPGMMIDLGSIGKGYALDVAVEALLEAGIERALVHGGTSTVVGLSSPPDAAAWKVAIDTPKPSALSAATTPGMRETPHSSRPLAVVELKDEALSVSAPHGKCFHADGRTYGHVLDPRTGAPGQNALLAAVVLRSATESDALSTALLLGGDQEYETLAQLREGMRTLVMDSGDGNERQRIWARGIAPLTQAG